MTEYNNSPLILIIDDDPNFRSTVVRMVERLGYSTIEATDGATGVAAVRQNRIAIALIDMLMPELDGFETIREIRGVDADIRIIAMSGGSTAGNGSYWNPLLSGRALCADQVLDKPFRLEALRTTIEACLRPETE